PSPPPPPPPPPLFPYTTLFRSLPSLVAPPSLLSPGSTAPLVSLMSARSRRAPRPRPAPLRPASRWPAPPPPGRTCACASAPAGTDRKSTRLNSSHDQISYAVFC